MVRQAAVVAAISTAVVASCTVKIPDGRISCAGGEVCPEGFFCHGDDLCYSFEEAPDGGVDPPDGGVGPRELDLSLVWLASLGGTEGDLEARGAAIDPGGAVYVVGHFSGSVDLGDLDNLAAQGESAGFLVRMDEPDAGGDVEVAWTVILDDDKDAPAPPVGDRLEDVVHVDGRVCAAGEYFGAPAPGNAGPTPGVDTCQLLNALNVRNGVVACFDAASGTCLDHAEPESGEAGATRRITALAVDGADLIVAGQYDTSDNLSVGNRMVGDGGAFPTQFAFSLPHSGFRSDNGLTLNWLAAAPAAARSRSTNKIAAKDGAVLVAGTEGTGVRDFLVTYCSPCVTSLQVAFHAGTTGTTGSSARNALFGFGKACVAGVFEGETDFGDGPRTPAGSRSGFIRCTAEADLAGAAGAAWVRILDGTDSTDEVDADELDRSETAIFVAGSFRGQMDLGGGVVLESEGSTRDGFLLALDPESGAVTGWFQFGGPGDLSIGDLEIAGDLMVVVGTFSGDIAVAGQPLTTEAPPADGFVVALRLPPGL